MRYTALNSGATVDPCIWEDGRKASRRELELTGQIQPTDYRLDTTKLNPNFKKILNKHQSVFEAQYW